MDFEGLEILKETSVQWQTFPLEVFLIVFHDLEKYFRSNRLSLDSSFF